MRRLMLPAVMVLAGLGSVALMSGSPTAQAQISYSPAPTIPCAGIQSVSPAHGPAGKLWVVKDCDIYVCAPDDKKKDEYTCAKQTPKFKFE